MAKHVVKCPLCGESFDTNEIQAVKVGARRYGHASCYPNNKDFVPMPPKKEETKEEKDMKALKAYINEIYGDRARWPLINKQIKDFTANKNFSLSGILKSLTWFYEVKGNTPDKSNGGIGIVEYCYQDAFNYYYDLFVAKSQNENIDVESYTSKIREVTIPLPAIKEKKRLFNLEDEE